MLPVRWSAPFPIILAAAVIAHVLAATRADVTPAEPHAAQRVASTLR